MEKLERDPSEKEPKQETVNLEDLEPGQIEPFFSRGLIHIFSNSVMPLAYLEGFETIKIARKDLGDIGKEQTKDKPWLIKELSRSWLQVWEQKTNGVKEWLNNIKKARDKASEEDQRLTEKSFRRLQETYQVLREAADPDSKIKEEIPVSKERYRNKFPFDLTQPLVKETEQ